jgi:tripartite ATP-independent transporter DctM subunit
MSEQAMVVQEQKQLGTGFFSRIESIIKVILTCLIAVMSVLIVYQVFCRYVLNSPSNVSEELLRYSLIWLGILGSSLCFMQEKHLNLPLLLDKLTPEHRSKAEIFNTLMNITLGAVITYGGWLATNKNLELTTPILKWSMGILQSVLVIAGILILLHQVIKLYTQAIQSKSNVVTAVIITAVIAGISLLVVHLKAQPDFEDFLFDNLELLSFLVLFFSFFTFLILGTPIAVGLALAGLMTLGLQIDFGDLVATTGEKLFSGLDSFGFLALPFFILAGNIMNQGGIAERLITLAMLFGKRVPGSLWQTNIAANMMFGSLSGSAIAASSAIGGIITPMAREKKYNMAFTTAVNAASSICGMLIPPTGVFIVYSMITGGNASIAAMFLAGYVPGIIMGVSVMIVAYLYARKHNYPVDDTKHTMYEVGIIAGRAIPSLFLIVIVIGGIIGGIFTAIEASGIAVAYSLILAIAYRSITLKSFISILYQSAINSSVILFLIACSGLMSWSMTFSSIPDTVGNFLATISENKYTILLLINITLLIVGVFMDMSPAVLIFTPILYPVVTGLGVDPVHFGIILVYNLSMGIVTPPVGTVLFVSCNISGEKITNVIKPLLPIFLIQFIGLMLVTYLPFLSLALPRFFGLIS